MISRLKLVKLSSLSAAENSTTPKLQSTINYILKHQKQQDIHSIMASVSMAASFLGGATTISPAATSHRKLVITNSVKPNTVKVTKQETNNNNNNGRRDIMFAAAAAAVCSVAGVAAAVESKRGTEEAKKFYASVCVANPTARVCHN